MCLQSLKINHIFASILVCFITLKMLCNRHELFSIYEFVFSFVNISNIDLAYYVFHCSDNNLKIVIREHVIMNHYSNLVHISQLHFSLKSIISTKLITIEYITITLKITNN